MKWIKRIGTLVAFGVLLTLFWPLVGEIRQAYGLLKSAAWTWLPLVLVGQVVSHGFLTWLNLLALHPFRGSITWLRLAGVLTAMAFIEVAIPSAGASGTVLRVRLLGKHGRYTAEDSTFSLALESMYLVGMRGAVGLVGLAYLLQTDKLDGLQAILLGVLAAAAGGLVWASWRLLRSRRHSWGALSLLSRLWNRIAGRWVRVDLQVAEHRLSEFQTSLGRLHGVPAWKFWLAAAGRVGLDMFTLWLCFQLFRHSLSIGTLFTGYGLILLASGLTSLPGGIGLADVTAPVIFANLGVPEPVALTASLTYRLVAFWLLRLIGFLSWQTLEVSAPSNS